ncbi:MAG: HigA family addiction module antidote protein [Alphaproteobacteria bacterium]|nr:HigA family addiction module antidote protein [Alphaproteobacteria bacterium]MCB9690219.1 HigA family addiction module antidote protein [Alphaproteobacteria bacterium]MCB9699904.1 HigA family addiction module antidote protein [Alphaproteobacteria bacterium]
MWSFPEAHPGEVLQRRFLGPLGLSAAELARGCRMPRSRVSDLLAGKRAITADTAVRLAAFFRMDARDWMALQAAWDLAQVSADTTIVPLDPPGFLLGPLGATPLVRNRPSPPSLERPRTASLAAETPPDVYATPRRHRQVTYEDGTRALVSEPAVDADGRGHR